MFNAQFSQAVRTYASLSARKQVSYADQVDFLGGLRIAALVKAGMPEDEARKQVLAQIDIEYPTAYRSFPLASSLST